MVAKVFVPTNRLTSSQVPAYEKRQLNSPNKDFSVPCFFIFTQNTKIKSKVKKNYVVAPYTVICSCERIVVTFRSSIKRI